MKMQAESNCPLDNFNPCRQLKCAWFMKLNGKNPNTGEDMEEWGCAIAFMPLLMIENSHMQRQTGAAVESFRNEMAKDNDIKNQILVAGLLQPLPPQNDIKIIEGPTS